MGLTKGRKPVPYNKTHNRQERRGPSKEIKRLVIIPHPKFDGVYIGRGRSDSIMTKALVKIRSVYGEKRVQVKKHENKLDTTDLAKKINSSEVLEYRTWNPYRSKLGAGIIAGLDHTYIGPGKTVLYLGASTGTTVSHVCDIIGDKGIVYAVEFSPRAGQVLVHLARSYTNLIPIIDDARSPQNYAFLMTMVDTIICDLAQPDQARILGLNANHFLKENGGVVMAIKSKCINSTEKCVDKIYANEVNKLRTMGIRPKEQVDLEPYERAHAMVVGVFRPKKDKSQ